MEKLVLHNITMSEKIVYIFDKKTGELIGKEFAYQSPSNPKEFVIPNNGTMEKPLPNKEGHKVVYKNGKWQYESLKIDITNVDESFATNEVKIEALKNQLKDMDDKAIKCFMAYINGEPMPYDTKKVNQEMKAIRDKIDNLERLNG